MKSVIYLFLSGSGSRDPNIMDDFYVLFKLQNKIPSHLYEGKKGKKRKECLTNAHYNKDFR